MAKVVKKAKAAKKAALSSLPGRNLTDRQAKRVKGGTVQALPAVQKPGAIEACDGSVRPININFRKV